MTTATQAADSALARDEILEHVALILSSRRFVSAERNARFLRYVVETALNGRASEIKETVIGAEVYGRSNDYDPKSDSIVRVEASRLRQKLRSYYENEGQSAAVRVHIPTGSYVPRFERVDASEITPAAPHATQAPEQVAGAVDQALAQPRRWVRSAGFAAVLCVCLFTIVVFVVAGKRALTPDHAAADANAAWQEGVTLLQQDPHSGVTEHGAPATLVRAIERLEFSVAGNPNFAPAWASLAEAYDYAYAYTGRDNAEDVRRAEAAARRAIEIDKTFPGGHHMLGLVLGFLKWDFVLAERAYKRALSLDPRNFYAVMEYADLLREMGRTADAAQELRRARNLLPAVPQLAVKEAEVQLDMGRSDAALATASSAVELKQNYTRAHLALAAAYERKGDFRQALALYEHALQANPEDRRALPAYGYLLAKTGQAGRAQEVLERLKQMNSNVRNCAFQIAVLYAGLGDDEAALDWLERAWTSRQAHFPFASVEYRFRPLHNHPRFRELLHRVGLVPVT